MGTTDFDWQKGLDLTLDSLDEAKKPVDKKKGRPTKDVLLDESDRLATQVLFEWLLDHLQQPSHADQPMQKQHLANFLNRCGISNDDGLGKPDVQLVNRRLSGQRPMTAEHRHRTIREMLRIGAISKEDVDLLALHAPEAVGRPSETMTTHKKRLHAQQKQLAGICTDLQKTIDDIHQLVFGFRGRFESRQAGHLVIDMEYRPPDLANEEILEWEVGRLARLEPVLTGLAAMETTLEALRSAVLRHDSTAGVLPGIRKPEMTRQLRDRLRDELNYVGLPDDDDLP